MGEYRATTSDQPSSVSGRAMHQIRALFTAKRVGYSLAGAFVLAGTAAMASDTAHPTPQHLSSHNAATTSKDSARSSDSRDTTTDVPDTTSSTPPTTTHFSATTTNGDAPDVHLDVNGQTMPVPSNGSVHHTTIDAQGGRTTVDASGNTTTQGSSGNSNSSSFSVNVQSQSSSTTTKGGSSSGSQP